MVQFHQSYAYEDFIQGWRPNGSGFSRNDAVFFNFCEKARRDSLRPYVFIIDEINRGNLSKIFGEVMMLIEHDKRSDDYAIPLTYSRKEEPAFFVPDNVFLLGLMNTADRSLAIVDYALRRRFAFFTLLPKFGTSRFRGYLAAAGVPDSLTNRIASHMLELNAIIAEERDLGPGFEIGHSYFCPPNTPDGLSESWYEDIIRSEVRPLLEEYWFDKPQKVDELISLLLE